jgi:hypothetical protein
MPPCSCANNVSAHAVLLDVAVRFSMPMIALLLAAIVAQVAPVPEIVVFAAPLPLRTSIEGQVVPMFGTGVLFAPPVRGLVTKTSSAQSPVPWILNLRFPPATLNFSASVKACCMVRQGLADRTQKLLPLLSLPALLT